MGLLLQLPGLGTRGGSSAAPPEPPGRSCPGAARGPAGPASPQLLGALRFCLQGTRAPFCPVNGLSVRSPRPHPAAPGRRGWGQRDPAGTELFRERAPSPRAQGRLCAVNRRAGAPLGTGGDTKGRNGGTRPALELFTAGLPLRLCLIPCPQLCAVAPEMLLLVPSIPAGKGGTGSCLPGAGHG